MSFDTKLNKYSDIDTIVGGDSAKVEKTEKLEQDIKKGLSTTQGTNFLHPDYGLPDLIGTPLVLSDDIITSKIENGISQLVYYVQNIQDIQKRTQTTAPEEMVLTIKSFLTERDKQDLRQFNCYVEVLSEAIFSGTSILFSITV